MAKENMQLALNVLQMPLSEIELLLQEELECNPLLEEQDEEEELTFSEEELSYEPPIPSKETPFASLMQQAKECFSTPRELHIAETILGSLEPDGLLKTPIQEIALIAESTPDEVRSVLSAIKTFDPPGIAAESYQEVLLRQLKQDSFSYEIIAHFYQDLLHGKFAPIAKAFQVTEEHVQKVVKEEVVPLNFHPLQSDIASNQEMIPDVIITEELEVIVPKASWPPIEIKPEYRELLYGKGKDKELKSYLKVRLEKIKWLFKCIDQRTYHLQKIAQFLVEYAPHYFTGELPFYPPLSMSALAEQQSVHVSTISRAISNKYIDTTRGIYPLKAFFKSSQDQTKAVLKDLIIHEEKPLTDEELVRRLKEQGIHLSRRTVAKYRSELNLPTKQFRKTKP